MDARRWLEINKVEAIPFRELEMLLEHVCGCSRMELYLDEIKLNENQERELSELLAGRRNGRPIQYIIGEIDFADMRLNIDERALIPRPETEWIIERIVELEESSKGSAIRVLDLGSGSGCISLALKSKRPSWEVSGIDLSKDAIDLARINAKRLGLAVDYQLGNIEQMSTTRTVSGPRWDIIVSNPPYIPLDEKLALQIEVQKFEPHEALFAGDDPQHFYRHLARFGSTSLRDGGRIYLECHENFATGTQEIFAGEGYSQLVIENDLNQKPRLLRGQWEK